MKKLEKTEWQYMAAMARDYASKMQPKEDTDEESGNYIYAIVDEYDRSAAHELNRLYESEGVEAVSIRTFQGGYQTIRVKYEDGTEICFDTEGRCDSMDDMICHEIYAYITGRIDESKTNKKTKNIQRITESELKSMITKSVKRILTEDIHPNIGPSNEDWAYIFCGNSTQDKGSRHKFIQELNSIGKHITGTKQYGQLQNDEIYKRMLEAINKLGDEKAFNFVVRHQHDGWWKYVYQGVTNTSFAPVKPRNIYEGYHINTYNPEPQQNTQLKANKDFYTEDEAISMGYKMEEYQPNGMGYTIWRRGSKTIKVKEPKTIKNWQKKQSSPWQDEYYDTSRHERIQSMDREDGTKAWRSIPGHREDARRMREGKYDDYRSPFYFLYNKKSNCFVLDSLKVYERKFKGKSFYNYDATYKTSWGEKITFWGHCNIRNAYLNGIYYNGVKNETPFEDDKIQEWFKQQIAINLIPIIKEQIERGNFAVERYSNIMQESHLKRIVSESIKKVLKEYDSIDGESDGLEPYEIIEQQYIWYSPIEKRVIDENNIDYSSDDAIEVEASLKAYGPRDVQVEITDDNRLSEEDKEIILKYINSLPDFRKALNETENKNLYSDRAFEIELQLQDFNWNPFFHKQNEGDGYGTWKWAQRLRQEYFELTGYDVKKRIEQEKQWERHNVPGNYN